MFVVHLTNFNNIRGAIMDNQLARLPNNQTIKANRQVVDEIKKIAHVEERTIQTITNRLLKLGLKEYPPKKYNK